MAAGVGSRFGGLKQLEPIGPSGEIILDYSIHDAIKAGFDRVVFVIRREMETDFRELFGRHVESRIDTRYVFQELERVPSSFVIPAERQKPWGTGHAVLCCRDEIDGPFAVINADDFYGWSSYHELARWLNASGSRSEAREYCMVGFILGNTLSEHGYVSRGVCDVDGGGYLSKIREHTHIELRGGRIQSTDDGQEWIDLAGDRVVSMNMWGFTADLFGELERGFEKFLGEEGHLPKSEFFIPSVVMGLLNQGKVKVDVVPTIEEWVGVTHREDLPDVRKTIAELIDEGIYPSNLRGRELQLG